MSLLAAPDQQFLDAFESCALAPAQFRHRDHLRLAYIYLRLHSFEVALETMRSGLRRVLMHFGAPPLAYHETMTQAWLLAVRYFMRRSEPALESGQFLAQASRLLEKDIMFTHYSRETLLSPAARVGFVEPDLQPIPRYAG